MVTLQYTTVTGDRWDIIAFRAYGDAGQSKILIQANPDVKIDPEIPLGTLLNIPVQEDVAVALSSDLLPPWK